MNVIVQLKETSQPIHHKAASTYTKETFYCVQVIEAEPVNPDASLIRFKEKVYKYPLENIWRIVEDYGEHA